MRAVSRTILLVVVALLAAGCAGVAQETSPPPAREPAPERAPAPTLPSPLDRLLPEPEPTPVRWLAWGDSGLGNDGQRAVAEAARRVCERDGCDFVLQLGDNVYPDGVASPDDPQWREKFEEPFANLTMPFYAVLGNHDASTPDAREAQLSYQSERWRMPAYNYSLDKGLVAFYALDLTDAARRDHATPEDWASMDEMNETLDETEARWRVVFSHFPLRSDGKHGDAGRYGGHEGKGGAVRELLLEAACPRADLYLSGHDHILAWFDPAPPCPETALAVSGASASARPLARDQTAAFAKGHTLGFFWFEATDDALLARAYDAEGALLFEREMAARG